MKNILIMLFMGLMFASCSKVPSGHVGVKVMLLGGDKGVDTQELGVGRYWIGFNEELYLFPIFQQNYTWTERSNEALSFQTREGMEVSADIGITYSIDPNKVNNIFQKYRRGIDEITDTFLRNYVKDAFNKHASTMEVESVYGEGKSELMEKVEFTVRDQVREVGINVDKIYLVNSFKLPDMVLQALNKKIEATQRAQQRENELREAEAEAKKKIAEAEGKAKISIELANAEAQAKLVVAQAEAKANQELTKSLSPQLLKYKQIEKWNGVLSKFTGAGSASFLIEEK